MTLKVLTLLLLTALPGHAAAVFLDRFESTSTDWQAIGGTASVVLDPAQAHEGQALRYDYNRSDGFSAFFTLLQVPPSGAKAASFWIRTSRPSLLYFSAYESDESGYGTLFWVASETWKHVELSFDRLRLAEDKVDENGTLDVDQIGGVGFADLSAIGLGQFDGTGAAKLWVDDFSLTSDLTPNAYSQEGKLPFTLDNFECEQWHWIALQGEFDTAPEAGELTWTYTGAPPTKSSFCALSGVIGRLPAAGATHLLLTLSSERSATLAVMLQEEKRPLDGQDESRYYAVLDVPGGGQQTTRAIALDDLTLDTANGAGDENKRFDLDQVAMIMIGDVEAVFAQQPGPNTIVLHELELVGAN